MTWASTLAKSGRGACGGVFEATVRFLLWHVLQPAVYLAALAVHWGDLGYWQHLNLCLP